MLKFLDQMQVVLCPEGVTSDCDARSPSIYTDFLCL